MRVIPSVTDTTVPWVRMSVDAPKPSMRLLSNSLISDGLSCMFRLLECYVLVLPSSGNQLVAHMGQLGLHGSIEYLVAHLHPHTPNKTTIDGDLGFERQTKFFL